MKKNITICGLIAGLIVTVLMLAVMAKIFNLSSTGSMVLGYTSMLVAFSLIFVAIKNERDKYGNGFISFGKAFRIGMIITAIASTMYVLVWLIDYYYFIPDFYEKYSAHELADMKAAGASQAALLAEQTQIRNYAQLYRNPFFNAMVTYTEILPVGLIVSILAAIILKRKPETGNAALSS